LDCTTAQGLAKEEGGASFRVRKMVQFIKRIQV